MTRGNADKERLQAYQSLFGVIGRLLYVYPEKDLLDHLLQEGVFVDLPIDPDNTVLATGMSGLTAWAQATAPALDEAAFTDIRVDATRLFAGTKMIEVAPWESVYFNKERMIFQEETLEVRAWYRRYGMQIGHFNHEPDDHIGLELDFISQVLARAVEQQDAGDTAGAHTCWCDAVQFAREHPLRWVDQWSSGVQVIAQTAYYRALAQATPALLYSFVEEEVLA